MAMGCNGGLATLPLSIEIAHSGQALKNFMATPNIRVTNVVYNHCPEKWPPCGPEYVSCNIWVCKCLGPTALLQFLCLGSTEYRIPSTMINSAFCKAIFCALDLSSGSFPLSTNSIISCRPGSFLCSYAKESCSGVIGTPGNAVTPAAEWGATHTSGEVALDISDWYPASHSGLGSVTEAHSSAAATCTWNNVLTPAIGIWDTVVRTSAE